MREWNHDLGVVDTIYEEEDDQEEEEEELEERKKKEEEEEEDGSDSISPVTPSLSTTPSTSFLSPPPSLRSTVEEWSRTTGYRTDVVIQVHDRRFHLHRDPLISRSGYLRRRLTDSSTVTVSPPSTISGETFGEIVIFCYSSTINLSPSNIAAVKIAAEFLEMDDENDGRGNGNLAWQAEVYLQQEMAGDKENIRHALRACLPLLPAAATIAVRCLEALAEEDDGGWMGELTALTAEKFLGIAESMRTWFPHDHDLLYRIVDYYLEKHSEKVTEEEKSRLCFTINCTNLSHHLLLHLVQNPRLPLRFVVQAMLVDQLHTRHTFLHLSSSVDPAPSSSSHKQHLLLPSTACTGLTLGAILQRDAALRQSSHLRASMESTSFRIDSLERDLEGLRRRLRWSEEKKAEMESARSSSFRIDRNHIHHHERKGDGSSASRSSSRRYGLGRRLVNGLKSMFQSSTPAKEGEEEETMQTQSHHHHHHHRRNNSFT